jgi:mRNA interferase MazF
MPTTITYELGDVVLVPFPFTDQSAHKRRPAVIVSSAAYNTARPDVIILAITSQVRAEPLVGEAVV